MSGEFKDLTPRQPGLIEECKIGDPDLVEIEEKKPESSSEESGESDDDYESHPGTEEVEEDELDEGQNVQK